jgi:hypothetical protein
VRAIFPADLIEEDKTAPAKAEADLKDKNKKNLKRGTAATKSMVPVPKMTPSNSRRARASNGGGGNK